MHATRCRYLAAKCLAALEDWDEVLALLGDGELDDDELQDAVSVLSERLRLVHAVCVGVRWPFWLSR